jgi:arylsulfatase A-like enzyme
LRKYDPDSITLRPNWKEGQRVPGKKEIAAYYAAISAVDHQIGRILSSLDELGLRENTVVVVSSDHGDMLGSQGLRLKRKPWEESIRVPGIIRYPRVVRPGRRTELLSHIDLPATLLGFCGQKLPRSFQGTDFSGLLSGQAQPTPDSVFFQIFGPFRGDGTEFSWRGVRTDRYMYARREHSPWMLYDLQRDPFELQNLVDRPEASVIQRNLEDRLRDWMRRTGDDWNFDWTHPVEDNGRLYRHRTFHSVTEYLRWSRKHPDPDTPSN